MSETIKRFELNKNNKDEWHVAVKNAPIHSDVCSILTKGSDRVRWGLMPTFTRTPISVNAAKAILAEAREEIVCRIAACNTVIVEGKAQTASFAIVRI